MKGKSVSVFLISLVSVLLVLASCGTGASTPTATTTSSKSPPVYTTSASTAPTSTPAASKPQYGGTFSFIYNEPSGFDPANTLSVQIFSALSFCQDEMLQGDWSKGPAGTGETDWMAGYVGRVGLDTGSLAQSWEMPDAETIVFHIRQGVHFWNKPPVNGRELTADDVAWSMNREWTSPRGFPSFWFKPQDRPTSFKALDKWTVQIKVPAAMQGALFVFVADQTHIYAPEVVDKYGDYIDWRNQAGTGPYMLTDYVPASTLTYTRNPDYWMKDPLHPENQIPYVQTLKQFIITDVSTQLAAFRTAKLDYRGIYPNVGWEDAQNLLQSNSQLKYKVVAGADKQLWMRTDKTDLPFKDVRVRQALNLAVSQKEIVDKYYQGHADLLGHPYPPYKAWGPMYTPFDQMPASVQELFGQNINKAKQLLSDAGYPSGFKTNVVALSGPDIDFLSIIREYFLKIGVDMEIKPLETGVFASVNRMRQYDQMLYTGSPTAAFPYTMPSVVSETLDDKSYYENPKTRAVFNQVNQYFGKDDAKWMQLLKDITPFYLEQSVGIWMPLPQEYRMWWPWVLNYHGEGSLGYDNQMAFTRYVWIDQALKKSMGY